VRRSAGKKVGIRVPGRSSGILQPSQYPLRTQTLACQHKVGCEIFGCLARAAARCSWDDSSTLQLGKKVRSHPEPLRIGLDLSRYERIIHFIDRREIALDRPGLLSVKWNVGMRAVSHGRSLTLPGSFQERMQPQGLRLETLGLQGWRPQSLGAESGPNIAARAFDEMAPSAVLLSDQLPSSAIAVFVLSRISNGTGSRTRLVSTMGSNLTSLSASGSSALQQFFRSFYTADIEDTWIFQLLLVPAVAQMFDRKESEIELRDQLASRFRQFSADRLRVFKNREWYGSRSSHSGR